MRGEDRGTVDDGTFIPETPPRAWGRLLQVGIGGPRRGNTPTCVGKTKHESQHAPDFLKHPHVRGEDIGLKLENRRVLETPPRAWGRPDALGAIQNSNRNTPTCVGKTHNRPSISSTARETPPRAWGRLDYPNCQEPEFRNTPTCVGKTASHGTRKVLSEETPPRAWGRRSSSPV